MKLAPCTLLHLIPRIYDSEFRSLASRSVSCSKFYFFRKVENISEDGARRQEMLKVRGKA